MARVIIKPQTADNLRSLVRLAVENQLGVINFGIAKTKGSRKNNIFASHLQVIFGRTSIAGKRACETPKSSKEYDYSYGFAQSAQPGKRVCETPNLT